MAPPRKQQVQRRSNSAPRLGAADSSPSQPQRPDPPSEVVSDEALEAWDAIWHEPQAAGFTAADGVILRRYIVAFEHWLTAMASIAVDPLVTGSMGQQVANPLMSWATSREAVMDRCERQLGIGLRNRTDLGVSVVSAKLTAAQLNAMTAGAAGDSPATERKAIDPVEAEIIDTFEIE